MKTTILFLALFLSVGCYHDKKAAAPKGPADMFGHEQILMQIICCAPGSIKTANTATCATLANVTKNISTINGVRVWGVQSASDCVNLDETPYWGEP